MFRSNGEVEVVEEGKKEKNWKDEMRVSRCFLWLLLDVGHEDYMNRAKIWYHKVKTHEGTSPVTKKVSPDFFESRVIIMRMSEPLFSEENVSPFSHRGSKTFCLFPANLATP